MNDVVSIIVIADEKIDSLIHTVDNLLLQEFPNIEIIIVDKEMESSREANLCSRFNEYNHIHYLVVSSESNYAFMVNEGVSVSGGDYIAFVHAGTLWNKDRLGKQLKLMTREGGTYWSHCVTRDMDKKYVLCPDVKLPLYKKQGMIFPDLILDYLIDFQSVIIKREIYEALGGLDENLGTLAEYEFLLHLALLYPIGYYNEILLDVKTKKIEPIEGLAMECYILCEFANELKRLGIKKEKCIDVIRKIEKYHLQSQLQGYLDILKEDSDYKEYLEEYEQQVYPDRKIIHSNTGDVSGIKNCVGCGACVHKCPVNAIQMKYNRQGFPEPVIDRNTCISCGKCLLTCPTQVKLTGRRIPEMCYAMQAEDGVRKNASSGGIFPLIARMFLKTGGYVAGAIYDEKFHVKHIVSNKEEDLIKMQTSKYVQSDTTDIYSQIQKLLENGNKVLFSGCVCQIAALKTFLEKEYTELYTVDVVCHGVPSVQVYENYIKEFEKRYGELEEVSFRKKDVFGWNSALYIRSTKNEEYVGKGFEPYMFGFLQNWFLRESCYNCEFKGQKYSDLTLGDFWGIQNWDSGFEDGKGTSYVSINSTKGYQIYQNVEKEVKKIKSFENRQAVMFNPNIKVSVERTPIKDIFFDNWNPNNLRESIGKSLYSQHFDIGLVLWWSPNHGNAITNYALYTVLKQKYKVLAIDSGPLQPQGRFRDFAKRNYVCSSEYYPKGTLNIIQECCNTFIVGSDQTWNRHFEKMLRCGNYYQLDFVDDRKRKISYAASFGMKGAEPAESECVSLYQRFHRISVREEFGIAVCKEKYQKEARLVLDPVFLLNQKEYDSLIDMVQEREKEPYIVAYLLNPTPEKREACKKIQEQLGGIKIINLTEGDSGNRDDYRHILEFDNIKQNVTIEEWLCYMKYSTYVVTDSFHGTCFSVIFQKNFMSFVNRQPDRFHVFKRFGDASSHIGKKFSQEFLDTCLQPLDYQKIDVQLKKERDISLKWLEEALDSKNIK